MTYVPGPSHALSTRCAMVLEGDAVISPCPLLTGKVSEIQKGLVTCPMSPRGNQGSIVQRPNTWEHTLSVSSFPSQSQGAHLVLLCVPTGYRHNDQSVDGGFKSISQIDSDFISQIVLSMCCSEQAGGGAMLFRACGDQGLDQWVLSSSCLYEGPKPPTRFVFVTPGQWNEFRQNQCVLV